MKKTLLSPKANLLFVFVLFLTQFVFAQTEPPSDLDGEDLKEWFRTNYYDGNHQTLGYSTARMYMYNYIDNENGVITCVYSGYQVSSPYGGTTTYPAPINCEHTIPQSFFGEADPMVSDLHHLYPAYENWNSTRSNYPFADIDDSETAKWMYLDQSQTTIPTSNIDLYSEYANSTFEPREDHKGNVARSIFYFYTMYPTEAGDISNIGDINTFYQWHLDDPVDAAEIERNDQIETYQGDRNPYIDYPETVALAWGFSSASTENPPSTPTLTMSAGETSIGLSWTNVTNENGYKLYKSTNGSSYSLLSTLSADVTSYDDSSVSEDITYYYYIVAYNDYGDSDNSTVVSGQLSSGGSTGTGISVSEALAESIGTDVTVDGIITESFNGIYALVMQDIDGTETIIVKLETDQRDQWSPENDPSVVGKTIEVVGTIDTYSSLPSIEYVTSITEISSGSSEDTEAPTAPSSLASASITQTTFTLSWTASTDNVAVTGYNIYQNGSLLATTTSTSYSVTGLTASTTYSYYITAEDAAGNVSDASSTLSVTTSDADDTEAPTAPTSLASASVTETSFTLSWTASTDDVAVTGYKIYQNSSLLATTTSTSYSVTGLTASTTYSYYITAVDAAGNVSSASSTLSVTTSDATLEYCSSEGSTYSYEWISEVVIGDYTNSSSSAGYTDFTSETITLEAGSSVSVSLTPGFSSSSYNEYWKIWIDYDKDYEFADDELVFDAGSLSSSTVTGTINVLSTATGTTRMRVSMKYNAEQTACETFSYGEVEDYTVSFEEAVPDTEAPTAPTSLAASSVTSSTATLSWTASTDNVAVTSYNIYQDGSLVGTSTTTSYTASGLSSLTTYSFYVTAEDAAGNVSSASSTVSATTSDVQITYCDSYGNTTSDEWIEGVEIAEISNTSGDDGGYADYTSLTANLTAGSTYSITLYTGYSGTAYKEVYSIWIDYNQDGTFDESTELAFTATSRVTSTSGSITIPSDALSGTTRMRISMKYNKAATPCEAFTYGEVEDYTVNITNSSKSATESTLAILGTNVNAKLYPNPANGETTLELITDDITNVSYKVIDLQGRVLITKDDIVVNGYQEERIDISNLKNGIYFIMVYNNKINNSYKLIVK